MSCCGRTRAPVDVAPPRRGPPAAEPQFRPPAFVTFEYTGATRLLADGPVTRRRYRFEHTGAQLQVDGRDAASFAAIPNLRRLAGG